MSDPPSQHTIEQRRERRVTNNEFVDCPTQFTGNLDFRDLVDCTLVDVGDEVQIFDKGRLHWRQATVTADHAAGPQYKYVQFENTPPQLVNLERKRWKMVPTQHYQQQQFAGEFSVPYTNHPVQERLDALQGNLQTINGNEAIFLPGTSAQDDIQHAETLGEDQPYHELMMYNFCRTFILETTNYERHRVLVLSRLVLPDGYFEEGNMGEPTEAQRQTLRDHAKACNIPPLYTFDIVMFPIRIDSHTYLLYGEVDNRTLFALDPWGPEFCRRRGQQITIHHIRDMFNDLWHASNEHLHTLTEFWRLPESHLQHRNIYEYFDLPIQPPGVDHNCGPVVCAYVACIGIGLRFNYEPRSARHVANFFTPRYNHVTSIWTTFIRDLRNSILQRLVTYTDNWIEFRFPGSPVGTP